MKIFIAFTISFLCSLLSAQQIDTFMLKYTVSKYDTIVYRRIIQYNRHEKLYHVRDYFKNGQIQMDAYYSSFDRNVKEEYQCNYAGNTKEGPYIQWYDNGQVACKCSFRNGFMNGYCETWYRNGRIESSENLADGQLHGRVKYWSQDGKLAFSSKFNHGENSKKESVKYKYLKHLPEGYDTDTSKRWPLVIFLHGGSSRGKDLNDVYDNGIPDQIYRGRKFPFIVVSPQCPWHLRWTTEDWFENLYSDVIGSNRVDTNRIYLTGLSLGGEGVWYIASKYPGKFAAIAPVSGFTGKNIIIAGSIEKLSNVPVWTFHSRSDNVVAFEESARMFRLLEGKNKNFKFSTEPDVGHWMHWYVYSGDELYDWLLQFSSSK